MPRKTIDSNVTGVAITEETDLKVLPGSPTWYNRAVNSYSDFGGEITTVASDSINASRQNPRGTTTDLDASGGFNIDMKNDLVRDLQGFFFADARGKPDTKPLNGTATVVSAVSAAAYTVSANGTQFTANMLVFASGFTNAANNGVSLVTASTATSVTTNSAKVVSTPPATARLQACGQQFASGDLALTIVGGTVALTSTAAAWANVNINVGEWVFIGGDAVAERYNAGYGFGRVKSKTNSVVVLDDVAWTGGTLAADAGAGKTLRVFYGTYIRNEKDPALIKRRSYQIERTLGSDGVGTQAEYLVGAVANELTLNLPLTDKHTADLTYMALDNESRTGTEGVKPGTHADMAIAKPYNTSSSVWRLKMAILDPATLNPTLLFGYVSDATFTINNNASATKAVGVLGGIDVNVGSFVVGGQITAYFTTVDSVKAIRQNKDVGFNAILSQGNKGLVYDIPLLGVGGGRITVEKDAPITVPLENFGAENENGYTASVTSFDYLPNVAIPV